MKIGIFLNVSDTITGSDVYEDSFLRLLSLINNTNDIEVVLIQPVSRKNLLNANNFDTILFKDSSFRRYLTYLRSTLLGSFFLRLVKMEISSIEKKLINHGVNIILFTTPNIYALGIKKIPIVTTVWDTGHYDLIGFPEFGGYSNFDYLEYYYYKASRKSIRVLADSHATSIKIQKFYNCEQERILVIGTRWVVYNINRSIVRTRNVLHGNNFIYYPAAFWKHKNHKFLIDVFNDLSKLYPNIDLLLSGIDRGYRKEIENYVRNLNLTEKVHFLGYLERELQLDLLSQADCLVMPSLLGPTNIPPFEAASFGIPCVISPAHDPTSYKIRGIYRMKNYKKIDWVHVLSDILEDKNLKFNIKVNNGSDSKVISNFLKIFIDLKNLID
jgi:glycosyltransferase involved in cell wall biosynthesis